MGLFSSIASGLSSSLESVKRGGVMPSDFGIDPDLRSQLESRGMTEKIKELEGDKKILSEEIKKPYKQGATIVGDIAKSVGKAVTTPEGRKIITTGFQSGVLSTESAVETVLSIGAKKFGLNSANLESLSAQAKEGAKNIQNLQFPVEDKRAFSEKVKDPNFIAWGLGQNLPNMLFALGVTAPAVAVGAPTAVVGALGYGASATLEGGFAYQSAKEFGADNKTAEKAAAITGLVNGALEFLPLGRILDKLKAGTQLKRQFLRDVVGGIVKQAGTEAGTESIQEVVSNSAAQLYDKNRDLFQGVPESAFFGGLTGGFMDLGATVLTSPMGLTIKAVGEKPETPEQPIQQGLFSQPLAQKPVKTPAGNKIVPIPEELASIKVGDILTVKGRSPTGRTIEGVKVTKITPEGIVGIDPEMGLPALYRAEKFEVMAESKIGKKEIDPIQQIKKLADKYVKTDTATIHAEEAKLFNKLFPEMDGLPQWDQGEIFKKGALEKYGIDVKAGPHKNIYDNFVEAIKGGKITAPTAENVLLQEARKMGFEKVIDVNKSKNGILGDIEAWQNYLLDKPEVALKELGRRPLKEFKVQASYLSQSLEELKNEIKSGKYDGSRNKARKELPKLPKLSEMATPEEVRAKGLPKQTGLSLDLVGRIFSLKEKAIFDLENLPERKRHQLTPTETSFDKEVKNLSQQFSKEVYKLFKEKNGEYPIGFINLSDSPFDWRDAENGEIIYEIAQSERDPVETYTAKNFDGILADLKKLKNRGRSSEIIQSDIQYDIERTRPKEKIITAPTKYQKGGKITEENLDDFIGQYIKDAQDRGEAIVVDADIFKDINKDFDTANREKYSAMSEKLFEAALKVDKNPIVKMTAGGPGSGKTDFLVPVMKIGFDGIIADSPHSYMPQLEKRLGMIEKAGKEAQFEVIIANIKNSRYYTLLRAEDITRTVDLRYFIDKHIELVDTYTKLLTEHPELNIGIKDLRNVTDEAQVGAVDFLRGKEALDLLKSIRYNRDELYDQLKDLTIENFQSSPALQERVDTRTEGPGMEQNKRAEPQGPVISRELPQENRADKIEQAQPGTSAIPKKADFLLSKSEIEPAKFAEAVKKRQQILAEAQKGERGAAAQVDIENRIQKLTDLNSDVARGLKRNPYFIKEKQIKDDMGEGWLMDNAAGQTIVATAKQVPSYLAKGYSKRIEIDSLAHEAGFEKGYDYLQFQLELSELPRTTDLRTVLKKELAKEPEYSELDNYIKEIDEDIEGETVSAKRFLLEKGKRELERRQLNDRRIKLRAVQEYFGLSDSQMKRINYADLRKFTPNEFNDYLNEVQAAAFKESEKTQAKSELVALIKQREFKKWENLQKAMELPSIENMTTEQLRQFESALEPYREGDEFLTTRKLETINKTDLAGIKTIREAREKFATEIGLPPDQLKLEVGSLDKWSWDTVLAEKDPIYKFIVTDLLSAMTKSDGNIIGLEHQTDKLFNAARKGIGLVNKVVPQDPKIFDYIQSTERLKLAENMTPEEIKAAEFVKGKLTEMYDHLREQKAMGKSRFENIYLPHIQRGFFEAVKDDGLKTAIKEMLHSQKIDEESLTILDQKTGKVLPMEKWFRFKVFRTGGIAPTKNVAKAFLTYARAFETKKALDSHIPKIMTLVDILTPQEMTERGIVKDERLKTFITEYINTRKGRPVRMFVKPGDPIDVVLTGVKTFTMIKDLGLNIPLQLGSHGGVQTALYTLLGPKNYAKGVARLLTKKGQATVKEYENYVERTPWNLLADSTKGLPEKTYGAMFALFRDATVRGSKIQLLGSMTDTEYAAGKITDERLAQLKLEAGRWLPIEKSSSIMGSTTEGKIGTQYRKWAIVIMRTNLKNIFTIIKKVKRGNFKEAFTGREAKESLRVATVIAAVSLLAYAYGFEKDRKKVKAMGFVDRTINKFINDSFSLLWANDPSLIFGTPRVVSFVQSLLLATTALVKLEEYKASGVGYKKGNLKAVNLFKRLLLPTLPWAPAPETKPSSGKLKLKKSSSTGKLKLKR